MSPAVSVPLLDERAALLPWSRIENRAADLAGCVANEGDPRMIATLDVEFILRESRHGRRPALVEIKDRPAACGFNDELAVRDTDLKLDTVRGDRLPGKGDNERIGLLLAVILSLILALTGPEIRRKAASRVRPLIGLSSIAVMRSPAMMPALAAGPPSAGLTTLSPSLSATTDSSPVQPLPSAIEICLSSELADPPKS